jgi:hypothetical protein
LNSFETSWHLKINRNPVNVKIFILFDIAPILWENREFDWADIIFENQSILVIHQFHTFLESSWLQSVFKSSKSVLIFLQIRDKKYSDFTNQRIKLNS